MIDAAAERIATALVREAFAHLPAERAAGAIAMARTEPIARALKAMVLEAYNKGCKAGNRQGRLELTREMEDDWRPIAERVRGQAGALSQEDVRRHRTEQERAIRDYLGGPVDVW